MGTEIYRYQSLTKRKNKKAGDGNMPVDIVWEDGDATIHILCDGCDKEYDVLTSDTAGLELCTFCGHYLEVDSETGEIDESEEDSWD